MDSSQGAVSEYGTQNPSRQDWQCLPTAILKHTAILKTLFTSLDTSYHTEQRPLSSTRQSGLDPALELPALKTSSKT